MRPERSPVGSPRRARRRGRRSCRRRPLVVVLLLFAGVTAAGCATRNRPVLADAPPPTTVAPTVAPMTSPPTTPAPTTTAPPRPVTLAFGGDVYGHPPVARVLDRGENPLAAVAGLLSSADVAIVNLETAVGSAGAPRDKQFVFQAKPVLLDALRDAGVDVVSVANNHSFDHGLDGFLETLDNVAASGLIATGGGRDAASAYTPAYISVDGVEVAILGLAVIGPEDDDRAVGDRPGTTNGRDLDATIAAVRAAKQRTPVVAVFVHWGAELGKCPRASEQTLAQHLLDAGASVVIGAHPHVLQAIDVRDGQLVAYSIGNFVFRSRSEVTRATGVLHVTIDPSGSVIDHAWHPARIDDEGRPIPLEGQAAEDARAHFHSLPLTGASCAA